MGNLLKIKDKGKDRSKVYFIKGLNNRMIFYLYNFNKNMWDRYQMRGGHTNIRQVYDFNFNSRVHEEVSKEELEKRLIIYELLL